MAEPPPHPAPAAAWGDVAACLAELVRLVGDGAGPSRLAEMGPAYARLGAAYLRAVEASGRRSIRAAAVARALDLHTPKSELEAFVAGRGER